VIVMGHGLGATRDMRLADYAERFRSAGHACVVFDYRNFGASGGEPRQLLDIGRQLDDWAAAIAFARSRDELDPDRLVLWGTSFGGGHVIAAALDAKVAAVISQCPFTDGLAAARVTNPRSSLKVAGLAVRDAVGSRFGRPPVMVALAGPPGSAALMTAPDVEAGYSSLIPDGVNVRGEVAARIALHILWYRPGKKASQLTCPILFCICANDSVAPPGAAQRYALTASRGEVRVYPYGHFEIYLGDPFDQVVIDQLAFLARHVTTVGATNTAAGMGRSDRPH
jgi:pimeloyl-ACP methyl ester carboxylesterase